MVVPILRYATTTTTIIIGHHPQYQRPPIQQESNHRRSHYVPWDIWPIMNVGNVIDSLLSWYYCVLGLPSHWYCGFIPYMWYHPQKHNVVGGGGGIRRIIGIIRMIHHSAASTMSIRIYMILLVFIMKCNTLPIQPCRIWIPILWRAVGMK